MFSRYYMSNHQPHHSLRYILYVVFILYHHKCVSEIIFLLNELQHPISLPSIAFNSMRLLFVIVLIILILFRSSFDYRSISHAVFLLPSLLAYLRHDWPFYFFINWYKTNISRRWISPLTERRVIIGKFIIGDINRNGTLFIW